MQTFEPRYLSVAERIELRSLIDPAPQIDPDEHDDAAEAAVSGAAHPVIAAVAYALTPRVRVFTALAALLLPFMLGGLVELHDRTCLATSGSVCLSMPAGG